MLPDIQFSVTCYLMAIVIETNFFSSSDRIPNHFYGVIRRLIRYKIAIIQFNSIQFNSIQLVYCQKPEFECVSRVTPNFIFIFIFIFIFFPAFKLSVYTERSQCACFCFMSNATLCWTQFNVQVVARQSNCAWPKLFRIFLGIARFRIVGLYS